MHTILMHGFCGHCTTVFQAIGHFFYYCPCLETHPSLAEEKIWRGIKKRKVDNPRKQRIQEKRYNVFYMYECDWRKIYTTDKIATLKLWEFFPQKMSL